MKKINNYILEKLHISKDYEAIQDKKKFLSEATLSDEQCLNKIIKALTTIYNDKLTVCEDYQGDKDTGKFFEINPETLGGGRGNGYNAEKLVRYCKKIEGMCVKDVSGLLSSSTYIGNPSVWIKIIWGGAEHSMKGIQISSTMYYSDVFPKDQSNVAKRGWNRWAGKAW